ncbi:MAG: type II secretion system F family protein [Euzebyales bacterium]|nr:type II secretion system F family protein [Euzebyales bacterium]
MPLPILLSILAVGLSAPLLWWSLSSSRPVDSAVRGNLTRGLTAATDLRDVLLTKSASERAVRPVMQSLADFVRRFLPGGLLQALETKITLAGRPTDWPVERVLAAKLLLGVGGLLLGLLNLSSSPGGRSLLFAVAATGLGCYGPDMVLARRARERQRQIQLRLPDTLDQITICVEAGLGFEAAMARAGGSGKGPLAEELVHTLQEMQIGATRGQALRALLDRTDAPDLRRFVLALLQAESYGLPIADVLRTQAAELRVKRRQRAEEHAMKIPVKVIFPLVLCILPTLMMVVLGPAGIRMARFFGSAGGLP